MKSLSRRLAHLGTESAFSVMARAREFEMKELAPQGKRLVYLQIGEPAFNTPEHIKAAAHAALDNNETHYTPAAGLPALREAIAAAESRKAHVSYNAGDVVVMPAAKSAIFHMFNALLDEGDEVIIPNPGFPMYDSIAHYLGAKSVPLPLLEENRFNFSREDLESRITDRTKLLVINSPHNPTGGMLTRETLHAAAETAKAHDLWVLSDEIYEHITYGEPHESVTQFSGMSERTVIVNGVSKAFAMTGWRLGWAVTRHSEMRYYLEKLIINDVSCTAGIIQRGGIEALTSSQTAPEVMAMNKEYRRRRDLALSLTVQIPGFRCHTPDGAFYLFINITRILDHLNITSSEFADRLMREAHVLVLPGTAFGAYGEGFIRLSYVSADDDIIEGLSRIKQFVCSLGVPETPSS